MRKRQILVVLRSSPLDLPATQTMAFCCRRSEQILKGLSHQGNPCIYDYQGREPLASSSSLSGRLGQSMYCMDSHLFKGPPCNITFPLQEKCLAGQAFPLLLAVSQVSWELCWLHMKGVVYNETAPLTWITKCDQHVSSNILCPHFINIFY